MKRKNITPAILVAMIIVVALIPIFPAMRNLWAVLTIVLILGALVSYLMYIADERLRIYEAVEQTKDANEFLTNQSAIGFITYNPETLDVLYHNAKIDEIFTIRKETDHKLNDIHKKLVENIEKDKYLLKYKKHMYEIVNIENSVFVEDVTDTEAIHQANIDRSYVIGYLSVDNAADLLIDYNSSKLDQALAKVQADIEDYARANKIYYERIADSKYIFVLNHKRFEKLREDNFSIIKKIETTGKRRKFPITASAGFSCENNDLFKVVDMAQDSLEIALNRGGNQVVFLDNEGEHHFIGGNTKPLEKRSKVRIKATAELLEELLKDAKQVVIMPHRNADMDAFASAYTLAKIAERHGQEPIVYSNISRATYDVRRAYDELSSSEQNMFTDNIDKLKRGAVVFLMDTSNYNIVENPALVKDAKRVAIIDHHVQADYTLDNTVLSFVEVFSSSTSEILTEIYQHLPKPPKFSETMATLLLAGILVDTQFFSKKVGTRTFQAAAFLKKEGASMGQATDYIRDDVEIVHQINQLINEAQEVNKGIHIIASDDKYSRTVIAKAANELIDANGVEAVFAIAKSDNRKTVCSARSNGSYNVQVIMESIGGGGHPTVAAGEFTETPRVIKEKIIKELKG